MEAYFATLLGDLSTTRAEAWLVELIELSRTSSHSSQWNRTVRSATHPIPRAPPTAVRALWRKRSTLPIRQIDELVADMTR